MNEIVTEWIRKAEADIKTARREFAVKIDSNYDAVCFHAQQCIEKLIKALLTKYEIIPPKSHDLAFLYRTLPNSVQSESIKYDELHFLSNCAVSFRYPGESADMDDAKDALQICEILRTHFLQCL